VGRMQWQNTNRGKSSFLPSKSYVCGHCGNPLASEVGYYALAVDASGNAVVSQVLAHIYICHYCDKPTYFDEDGKQIPGSAFGGDVRNIPNEEVKALYDEARNCMKVSAYTAAVMCCRKLLMNVAVSEGAEENKSFAHYVNYLAEEGHIPPKAASTWVDHIRDKGNDANHEIQIMTREDAERLIRFSEMMLRIMYEYPAEAQNPGQKSGDQTQYTRVPPAES
jgi:hypothetical protein